MIFVRTFYFDEQAANDAAACIQASGKRASVERRYSNGWYDLWAER